MKLGIVSDLHGNAPALRHALRLMGRIDRLVCLGDSINQYGFSNETVGLLRELDALAIWGNHEDLFFSSQGQRARQAPNIDPGLLQWLATRPRRLAFTAAGKSIMLTHATSWSQGYEYVYPHSPDFGRFAEADCDIVLYGHTHWPVSRQVGQCLVVNPGSTGEGRATDKGFILSCAVLDVASGAALFHDFLPAACKDASPEP